MTEYSYGVVLIRDEGQPILIGLHDTRSQATEVANSGASTAAVCFMDCMTNRWRAIPIHNVVEIYVAHLDDLITLKIDPMISQPLPIEPVTGCIAHLRSKTR